MKALYGAIREGFAVKRFHTVPHTAMPETVGHHTANVIAILFHLYDDNPPLYLIRAALHHDVPESVTGDVPATAKWKFPELAAVLKQVEEKLRKEVELSPPPTEDKHLQMLAFADIMDLCFKSVEELSAGNEMYAPILHRGMDVVMDLLNGPLHEVDQAHEIFQLLRSNKLINITVEEHHEQSEKTVTH